MSYSIVIPSRNIDNLTACVKALRAAGETGRVIVVWDSSGLPPVSNTTIELMLTVLSPLQALAPVYVEFGDAPFIFARNCNIGIRAAGDDDVVLLNDDALVKNSLIFICMKCYQLEGYGIMAATTNIAGYPQQKRRSLDDWHAHREVPMAAFICVHIPRSTIETVGLLDERFVTYGGDDVDYCLRVREAGFKVGVSDYCYVDHAKLPSTFRGPQATKGAPGGNIDESNRMGKAKWGDKWPHGRHK